MIRNLRDIGGISCDGGRKLKKDIFFRSALLSNIDEEDRAWMKEKKIKYIYDLRSSMEVSLHPDGIVENVININHYLQDETHDAFSYRELIENIKKAKTDEERIAMVPGMEVVYRAMVENDFCRERFAQLIRNIMNSNDGAVLFHCTSGKDRTGMTAATLLTMLGASREDIMKEYLLTLPHTQWEYEFRKAEFEKDGSSEALASKLSEFYLIKPAFLEAFFDAIEKRRGSFENYILEDFHIDAKSIEAFKNRVLE